MCILFFSEMGDSVNGIEQIKYYCSRLSFSTILMNRLTVDITRDLFARIISDSDMPKDDRLENITLSKIQKYLPYYDFASAIPDDEDSKGHSWTKGTEYLHTVFGDRDISVDEKNCYSVLLCATEDRYEKYDGSGYPKGKRKYEICSLAQALIISEQIAGDRLACLTESAIIKRLDGQSSVCFNPLIVEKAKATVKWLFDCDREWFALYGDDNESMIQMEYQPIFDCSTNKVCAYENRMVLKDSNFDPVLPTVYVPVAEKTNRIHDLAILQLEKICQRMSWARFSGVVNVAPVFFNVSAVCLKKKSFVLGVKKALAKYHIHPSNIVIEVTETALGYEDPQIPVTVSQLREVGVSIVIDHFGTEYSSLSGLGRFEVDIIKLDDGFMETFSDNKKTYEIVKSIVQLAHSLDADIIASGVKTDAQKELLTELSCRYMQGELFGMWESI